MKTPRLITALFVALILGGCRAHMVKITLVNTSTEPIATVIVDYPSATFGKDRLAPGETFSSTVKLVDTGAIKVQFTDARGASHSYTGPTLQQDSEGSVDVKLDQNNAVITPNIAKH